MTLKTYISHKLKQYFSRKRVWSIISDFATVLILILMMIPASRKEIIVAVRKLTMKQPAVASISNTIKLSDNDYQWNYQSTEGEVIPFSQHKNKVIFLNFWSTSCPHCIAELPGIEKLYNRYKNQVAFVLLTNESPRMLNNFLKKKNYKIPFYFTYGLVPEVFESRFIPVTFIISPEGKIVVKKIGPARWDGENITSEIDKMLKQ